jgi:hypothetical protein
MRRGVTPANAKVRAERSGQDAEEPGGKRVDFRRTRLILEPTGRPDAGKQTNLKLLTPFDLELRERWASAALVEATSASSSWRAGFGALAGCFGFGFVNVLPPWSPCRSESKRFRRSLTKPSPTARKKSCHLWTPTTPDTSCVMSGRIERCPFAFDPGSVTISTSSEYTFASGVTISSFSVAIGFSS